MRFRFFLLFAVFVFLPGISFSQKPDCKCGETVGNSHIRMAMKNRSIPADAGSGTQVTTQAIISWPVPSSHYEKEPATPYAKEENVYTVSGFAQIVKISDEDCDIHIELSPKTSGARIDRIVAEIPNTKEYCEMRKAFLEVLRENYGFPQSDKGGTSKKFTTESGFPRVTVTGYAFWDTAHWSGVHVNNKKGHQHGSKYVATMWEIHPVFQISAE